jgi:hypothetical protein
MELATSAVPALGSRDTWWLPETLLGTGDSLHNGAVTAMSEVLAAGKIVDELDIFRLLRQELEEKVENFSIRYNRLQSVRTLSFSFKREVSSGYGLLVCSYFELFEKLI